MAVLVSPHQAASFFAFLNWGQQNHLIIYKAESLYFHTDYIFEQFTRKCELSQS